MILDKVTRAYGHRLWAAAQMRPDDMHFPIKLRLQRSASDLLNRSRWPALLRLGWSKTGTQLSRFTNQPTVFLFQKTVTASCWLHQQMGNVAISPEVAQLLALASLSA
jgi:hypothetical protein